MKKCKHCGRPVSKTIGKLGYCKKCIALAKTEQQKYTDYKTKAERSG